MMYYDYRMASQQPYGQQPYQPKANVYAPKAQPGSTQGQTTPMQGQNGSVQAQSAQVPPIPSGATLPTGPTPPATVSTTTPGQLPMEQSYIENILRLNLGKTATIYMTFENNKEWNAKVFKGVLEAAGRDHIIISDPRTGMRFLLLMVNLDYITFDEELNYAYPFAPAQR